jgi:hypothetical protein
MRDMKHMERTSMTSWHPPVVHSASLTVYYPWWSTVRGPRSLTTRLRQYSHRAEQQVIAFNRALLANRTQSSAWIRDV